MHLIFHQYKLHTAVHPPGFSALHVKRRFGFRRIKPSSAPMNLCYMTLLLGRRESPLAVRPSPRPVNTGFSETLLPDEASYPTNRVLRSIVVARVFHTSA